MFNLKEITKVRSGIFLILMVIVFLPIARADFIYVEGDVFGQWSADSVYVIDEIRVPTDSILIIDPGVEVIFWDDYDFIVDTSATLLAVGTLTDTISFYPSDSNGFWGGIRFLDANNSSQLRYCHIKRGSADDGGAIYCSGSDISIRNCYVDSCYASNLGGGIYIANSSPTVTDNTISNNSADHGGGIYIIYGSPIITGNTIKKNEATYDYGGGICFEYSDLTIRYNTFDENSAGAGGGISSHAYNDTIDFNLFINNTAYYGGGIYLWNSNPTIVNCTISDNESPGYGGGIYCDNSEPFITNSIICSNEAQSWQQIYPSANPPFITYSDVCEPGWDGPGNINQDPLFRDPDHDDFHLQSLTNPNCGDPADSPCIDAGDPSVFDALLHCNRGLGGYRSDMGAYGGAGDTGNQPPIITNIVRNPSNPDSGQTCEVSANITDNDGYVSGANLYYDTSGSGYTSLVMGNLADSFFATIPGQPSGTVVCYFIKAWDDLGDTTYSDTTCYEVSLMSCLICNTVTTTPLVPNVDGTIIWSIDIENCGNAANDVFAEIYPTVGDCASGTQFDYNINRLAVNNLGAGDSTTLYYWYRPGTITGVIDAAINIDVGPAIDNYISNCCFEFMFAYEFGRPGTEISFGPGEWGEWNGETLLPTTTTLNQNFPNPFNATTNISFNLSQDGNTTLRVYNLVGQEVESLVDGYLQAGDHRVIWDASRFSSGLYFYKLQAGEEVITKRMTLLK